MVRARRVGQPFGTSAQVKRALPGAPGKRPRGQVVHGDAEPGVLSARRSAIGQAPGNDGSSIGTGRDSSATRSSPKKPCHVQGTVKARGATPRDTPAGRIK